MVRTACGDLAARSEAWPNRRLACCDEPVGAVPAFGHAQSGIGPMAAEKTRLVGCGAIQQTAATLDRKVRYRVDRKTPFRVSERNRGIRHNVACDDQSLAAGDLEGDVAGGVSWRVENPHAADDLVTGLERLQLVLDARQIAFCAEREALEVLGQLLHDIVGHPEIPLRLGDEIARVWKTQSAPVVCDAPQMIRLRVSENDLGDLRPIDPGRLQVLDQLPGRRLPAAARASIDQDEVRRRADQGNIVRQLHAINAQPRSFQESLKLRPRRVGVEKANVSGNVGRRQHEMSVTYDADLEDAVREG